MAERRNATDEIATMAREGLAENLLVRGVPADLLPEICAIPQLVGYADGEVIFEEGDPPDYLYLIAKGAVRISKRGRGGQQETLSHLREGDFFGEMGLFDPDARSARATAAQPTQLGRVDRADLERLLRLAPLQISANLTRGLIRRLRDTDARMIDEILKAERLSLVGSMAARMSHDLKNPISVMLLVSSMLEEREGDSESIRLAGILQRSIDRMLGMIREVLEYSRGQPELDLHPIPVHRLLTELEAHILGQLSEGGIRLEKAISFRGDLLLDHDRMLRVLENLSKNAVEAMPSGGVLTLAVEQHEENILIGVADTGHGIPEEILPTIFEPFVTHGKSGGTGLGMAIARAVVEAHGGTIRVESTVGQGSTFWIVLPKVGRAPGIPSSGPGETPNHP